MADAVSKSDVDVPVIVVEGSVFVVDIGLMDDAASVPVDSATPEPASIVEVAKVELCVVDSPAVKDEIPDVPVCPDDPEVSASQSDWVSVVVVSVVVVLAEPKLASACRGIRASFLGARGCCGRFRRGLASTPAIKARAGSIIVVIRMFACREGRYVTAKWRKKRRRKSTRSGTGPGREGDR